MRIRKNASKLILGSATSIYSSTIESLPNPFAAPLEAEEVICELNCSPWDAMLFNCSDSFSFSFFDGSADYDLEEEDGGSLGNVVKTGMEPISSITSNAAELTLKEMKEIESQKVGKKMKTKKIGGSSKGKERAAEETTSIQYCKKSDGKGWHCKRPALPHSRLCSYHLAQCRSYSSHPSHHKSTTDSSLAADTNDNGSKNRRAREANANLYYYYGGFGPSRGKRRGRSTDLVNINACDGGTSGGVHTKVGQEEVEKEDQMDGRESVVRINEENVAGDDEYDIDCCDDNNGGNYCGTQGGVEEANEIREEDGEEEKKNKKKKKVVLKKRGRKPIKARSLKSLL